MNSNIDKYIRYGYKKVEGWISNLALKAILKLSSVQCQNGINGSMCEIGVHHGRSFILLHMLANSGEISTAIDLFEMQSDNVDNSGRGNREIFLKNLKRNRCDLSRIKIITKNSLAISSEYLLAQTERKIRIFSVDGGHSADVVYNDLKLAESTICKGGIIILDDFFVNSWPGVSEGACRYLLSGESNLIPFSTFDGKILFTNDDQLKTLYVQGLAAMHPEFLYKESIFFNSKIIILYKSRNAAIDFFRRTSLWQLIKNNKSGTVVRRIVNR